jgi:hypothetical protein
MAEALDAETAAQVVNVATHDFEEAMHAFTEKREASFTGQ